MASTDDSGNQHSSPTYTMGSHAAVVAKDAPLQRFSRRDDDAHQKTQFTNPSNDFAADASQTVARTVSVISTSESEAGEGRPEYSKKRKLLDSSSAITSAVQLAQQEPVKTASNDCGDTVPIASIFTSKGGSFLEDYFKGTPSNKRIRTSAALPHAKVLLERTTSESSSLQLGSSSSIQSNLKLLFFGGVGDNQNVA